MGKSVGRAKIRIFARQSTTLKTFKNIKQLTLEMLSFSDLKDWALEIKFPDEITTSIEFPIFKTSLDKLKTTSFPRLNVSFRELVNQLYKETPSLTLTGKNSNLYLMGEKIEVVIFPNGEGLMFPKPKGEGKRLTEKDLQNLSRDVNFLIGSILGNLKISDKKLKTELSMHFIKKGIFIEHFNVKMNAAFVSELGIEKVRELSFTCKEKKEDSEIEIMYDFEHNDDDNVKIVQSMERVFVPVSIGDTIDEGISKLNEIINGW